MPLSTADRSAPPRRGGEHVCRLVHGVDGFRAAAAEFLSIGLARGERVMYVAERSYAELVVDVAAFCDVDELMVRGAVRVESTLGLYVPGTAFDGAGQVERYRSLTDQALEDGFTGLRVAADATAMALTVDARRQFIAYELAVDGLMAHAPMSAMCAYDVDVLGAAAGELCAVHPHDECEPGLHPGFRLCFGDTGLRLGGELDVANADLFAVALDAAVACSDRDVLIDASELAFIDARRVVDIGQMRRHLRASGRDLRLTGSPAAVHRLAALMELDDLVEAPPARTVA